MENCVLFGEEGGEEREGRVRCVCVKVERERDLGQRERDIERREEKDDKL